MKRSQKADPKNLSQTIAKPFARKKYDFTEEGDPKAGPELSAGDTKVLARLIRKYENKTVVAAAKVLPPGRGPGRPSRGLLRYYERMHVTEWIEEQAAPKNLPSATRKVPALKKSGFQEEEVLSKGAPQLSAEDAKLLARLIRKYGTTTVVAAAEVLPPKRGPGRPSRGLLPYYERMHLTEWIEERAEEHRQNGSTKPYIEAEIDVYEMLFREETPRDLQKFRRTIKKSRQQGRRDLIEHLQNTLKHPSYKGQQDLIQTLQHYQKHSRSYKTEK